MQSVNHGKACDLACQQAFQEIVAAFASEEKSLANLIEAEAERVMHSIKNPQVSLDQFIELNQSIGNILSTLIKREVLMQLKLDLLLRLYADRFNTEAENPVPNEPAEGTAAIPPSQVISTVPPEKKSPYASFPSAAFPSAIFDQRADVSPPIVVRFLIGKKKVRLAKQRPCPLSDKEK
ncbi:hypothetical protein GTO89_05550 [Heliobacterium gestii]|uniref:Uncharacterized protein n=1 Tax=Heliomicrobium gestii TaxID=2699 RepID=A0A845LDG0_HELGE|nr:hypothetical protein [Heliomicrobium gestii]MBM7866168.1 hypothetical protein [Heliomicrobium gestii]MZP42505.1 hypothetical protein [Heliomicrobium gestii]